jgi:isochorismate hydrolase
MEKEAKVVKPKRAKLDLVKDHQEFVRVAQKECRAVTYDIRKIKARLNCTHGQAITVAQLAQIADQAAENAKAAKA